MGKNEKKAINNGVKKKTVVLLVVCTLAVGVVFGGLGVLIYKELSGNAAERLADGEIFDFEKEGYIKLGKYKGLTAYVQPTDYEVYSEMVSAADEDEEEEDETDSTDDAEGTDGTDDTAGTEGTDSAEGTDGADRADEDDEEVPGEAVEDGNLVNLDFTGSLNGKEREDTSEQDAYVWIGKGDYIESFEKGIIGIRVGEEKTIDCKFPDDYDDETLAGKTVQFTVTVHGKCGEKEAQEATQGRCSTVQEYYEYEKAAQLEDNRNNKGELVWDELRDGVKVETVPAKMLERASEDIKKMYTEFAKVSEMEMDELMESFGMDEEGLEEMANDTVKDIMIAKTIAAKEGITMDEEYYRKSLMEIVGEEEEDGEQGESVTPGSIAALEAEYKESMGSRPRDEMLIERIKDFVGEYAEEGTSEEEDELILE